MVSRLNVTGVESGRRTAVADAPAMLPCMADLREAVLKELKRRKWSKYRLVQELKGRRADGSDVTPMTVYRFLSGASTLNSGDLGLIFGVLGLSVGPKGKR